MHENGSVAGGLVVVMNRGDCPHVKRMSQGNRNGTTEEKGVGNMWRESTLENYPYRKIIN